MSNLRSGGRVAAAACALIAAAVWPGGAQAGSDDHFGPDGVALHAFPSGRGEAAAVLPSGSGSLVIGSGANGSLLVGRFSAGGRLDRGFGDRGWRSYVLPTGPIRVVAAARDGLGRLVVSGMSPTEVVAVRLTRAGRLDSSFGGAGYWAEDLGPSEFVAGLAAHPDRDITLAITTTVPGLLGPRNVVLLVRRTESGASAQGFGAGGILELAHPSVHYAANSLTGTRDSGVLVTGFTQEILRGHSSSWLSRLRADGIGSSSGGSLDLPIEEISWSDAVELPDGRLVAVGNVGEGVSRFLVAFLPADGSAGQAKVVTFGRGAGSFASRVVLAGRRVLVGGAAQRRGQPYGFAIARFFLDGRIDRGFGQAGRQFTPIPGGAFGIRDLHPRGRGGVAVGNVGRIGRLSTRFALARYK